MDQLEARIARLREQEELDAIRPDLDGHQVMEQLGIGVDSVRAQAIAYAKEAKTPLFAAIDGRLSALIAIADPIKETTAAALDALRGEGVRIVMLTGDNRATARAVARRLAITEIEAQVRIGGERLFRSSSSRQVMISSPPREGTG